MSNILKFQAAIDEAAKEFPGLSFGYIGNIERWGDDRYWMVFLPHPGRVGGFNDSVRIGDTKQLLNHPDIDAVIWQALQTVRTRWSMNDREVR